MIHAPNVPTADAQRERLRDAARSLESMVLKTLVTSSGAFGGGDGPGGAIRADLFASTLADALAKGGGVGLAAQLERTLGCDPEPAAAPPAPIASLARRLERPAPAPVAPGSPDCARGRAADELALRAPVAGRISSPFGERRDPFTGDARWHDGVDIAAPSGSEIRAARPGRVIFAGPRGGYGNAVEIDHGDGVTTLYGHASALLVREGDVVRAGEPIGRVGSTGRSTGPHLHFEVRQDRRPRDPSAALIENPLRADDEAGAGSRPRIVRP